MPKLQLVGDPPADALLSADPFALLVGMLLDQQVPMEVAFAGPKKIADRMGGLDPHEIAARDPEEFAAMFAEKPAVHRFPGSMAGRVQALARAVVDQYGGDTTALWTAGDPDGAEVYKRLKALPGFGEQKARIFLALLGKQYGVTPAGWREAAGAYGGAGTHLSIADVVDTASLHQVRSTKKAQKQAAKQARESKGKAAT
ncbi:(Fe-S)-cluster assembly protein [Mycolicibacter terrae]|uniref:(Fe-S)-cluster assembly protein n=1 Tax=Mycolicibacter terrae TaxID=1788 RepID=A0AAD1MI84_9MYCO|nr:HhH-GPD-type base excision DNA repair protein [Mycolicibacter terrae]ORW88491.1 Fe-S cluster assembly protein HesB [Mycolicibacter terrae]BBX23546.1 (Fe-S)-cluster assembly protein [Mycolicibacter terrae]SNV62579.1 HhH-GPD family protein [Mycolicibacter terrae]